MAHYLLYSIVISVLICGTGIHPPSTIHQVTDQQPKALYFTRSRWLPSLPGTSRISYIYHRIPGTGLTGWRSDLESGLSSSQFDIAANIAEGDTRAGLDERAKREIRTIMDSQNVSFDEARRVYMQKRFSKNNIGPDGRPRDPKFVSFD